MVLGDAIVGYLFLWLVYKLTQADADAVLTAEKEFKEPRAKL